MINWRDLVKSGASILLTSGVDDAEFDAYQLILTFFDGNTTEYMLHSAESVDEKLVTEYCRLIDRRVSGEPLQYIIGKWDFYKSTFFVGDGVLIPRPETEELVEKCIELIKKHKFSVVYDLCTGSGCIGLSIAKECPEVTCYLFELYDKAFSYASKNFNEMNLSNVALIKHDVLKKYEGEILSADIIVSNPPYIESGEINDLQREVLREPITALDGGDDGLIFYRSIYKNWYSCLNNGGYFAFECGEKQTEDIIRLSSDICDSISYKDIYGKDRIVISRKL